jgi:hypothetical protein
MSEVLAPRRSRARRRSAADSPGLKALQALAESYSYAGR